MTHAAWKPSSQVEVVAIVLAGGLGTRLRSVLSDRPKPMADIGGRPFLAYVLDGLRQGGVQRVVVAVGHHGDVVRRYLADRRVSGQELTVSDDGEQLRGTGGAVAHALAGLELPDGCLVAVLNGDTFIEFDLDGLVSRHRMVGASITLVAAKVSDAGRYGSIIVRDTGAVSGFREKGQHGPGLVNGGVYLATAGEWSRCLLSRGQFSLEHDVMPVLADQKRLYAFLTEGEFVDMGTPMGLERARRLLPGKEV